MDRGKGYPIRMVKSINKDRRNQILEVALEAFSQLGYMRTTTGHIAKQIAVSQPYLFHFFPTKEQLFLEVLERGVATIYDAFARVEAKKETVCTELSLVFKDLLQHRRNEILLTMQAHSENDSVILEAARSNHLKIYQLIKSKFQQAGIKQPGKEARTFIAMGLLSALSEQLHLPELSPWCEEL
jgi:AcrR family transcriptional regulator